MKILNFKNILIFALILFALLLYVRSQNAVKALNSKCKCNGSSTAGTAPPQNCSGLDCIEGNVGELSTTTTSDTPASEGLLSATQF